MMYSVEKVSSSEALSLLAKAIELANKINKPIAVAVTGPEGELISFLRMEQTLPQPE